MKAILLFLPFQEGKVLKDNLGRNGMNKTKWCARHGNVKFKKFLGVIAGV